MHVLSPRHKDTLLFNSSFGSKSSTNSRGAVTRAREVEELSLSLELSSSHSSGSGNNSHDLTNFSTWSRYSLKLMGGMVSA